jgi:uncharacterized membrane protein
MPLIMRWVHIGAAIATAGGLFLLVSVIVPSLRAADPEQAVLLLRDALRRLWPALWILGAALVLSGFYAGTLVRDPAPPAYHSLLGIKVLLSFAYLASALVATRPSPDGAVRLGRRLDWLRLSLILGSAAVLLSSYLRELRLA